MTVNEAISKIHAPKGVTSILAGLSNGDYSVLPHEKGIGADLKTAEHQVALYDKQIQECKSDWAYWSILGDLEYWKAVRNILEAGSINNGILADVKDPDLSGAVVVMDSIGRVTDFGETILRETKKLVSEQTKEQ